MISESFCRYPIRSRVTKPSALECILSSFLIKLTDHSTAPRGRDTENSQLRAHSRTRTKHRTPTNNVSSKNNGSTTAKSPPLNGRCRGYRGMGVLKCIALADSVAVNRFTDTTHILISRKENNQSFDSTYMHYIKATV